MSISIDEIRENFAKQADTQNKKIYDWENKIETFYNKVDIDLSDGVIFADSLIRNDTSLNNFQISELHTLVGESFYDYGKYDKALERFYLDEKLTFDSPRNKANKAGCLIKQGDYESAKKLLEEASKINHDYKWLLGNYYEIQGEIEKAISEYKYVYQRDTIVYSSFNQRIKELKNSLEKTHTELKYRHRRRRSFILLKAADKNSENTAFGKIELVEKK